MKLTYSIVALIALGVVGGIFLLRSRAPHPQNPATRPSTQPAAAFRIGLVPEHDVFDLRKSYRPLTAYLSAKLGRPVEIVTLSSYDGILQDFQDRHVDAAFLGSLVAVLAMNRLEAQVLVKPEQADGRGVYRGIVFVRDDSPIKSLDQIGGQKFGLIRTTYAGTLYPFRLMQQHSLLGAVNEPKIVYMGTHDDVVDAVVKGRVDVGAVKDLRLEALEKAHPEWKLRRLATSEPVPNNALVLRADLAKELAPRLREIFLSMHEDADGRQALASLKAARFVPCVQREYMVICDLIKALGPAWERLGIPGPPPDCDCAATQPY